MGRMQRRKGHNWERECARLLSTAQGVSYQRVLTETRDGNSGDVRATDGEAMGEVPVAMLHRTGRTAKVVVMNMDDFLEIASALPAYRFLVQCKCGARPNAFAALQEAKEAI